MKWAQIFCQYLPQHKYAIDAAQLGDSAELAWTNLGYWQAEENYPQACQQLADRLAQAVQLKAQDAVLDLGCGQGASLLHWQNQYQVQYIEAVELQQNCVKKIGQYHLPALKAIYNQSLLALKPLQFTQQFDVVLCIDAAYHHALSHFLNSVTGHLKQHGHLGLHYLMLSDDWQQASLWQKSKYQLLVKAADLKLKDLKTRTEMVNLLENYGYEQIMIQDISSEVLQGFSKYVAKLRNSGQSTIKNTDYYKIQMTAKLCAQLYADGLIRYVQISAVKAE